MLISSSPFYLGYNKTYFHALMFRKTLFLCSTIPPLCEMFIFSLRLFKALLLNAEWSGLTHLSSRHSLCF